MDRGDAQVTDVPKFGAGRKHTTIVGDGLCARSLSLSLSLSFSLSLSDSFSSGWMVAASPLADAVAPLAKGEIPAERRFAQRNTRHNPEHKTQCELKDLKDTPGFEPGTS